MFLILLAILGKLKFMIDHQNLYDLIFARLLN